MRPHTLNKMMDGRLNLLGLDHATMRGYFLDLGEKPFCASQVLKWIYQRGVTDFQAMTSLGKAVRAHLSAVACIRLPEVIADVTACDGTRKWVLAAGGDNRIETVFIPERNRGTLCISSQVGCALNCSFCATGKQGFNRNLTAGEIVGQLWTARRKLGDYDNKTTLISNVVMMGMGEPLLNFDNVVHAMRLMTDDHAFGLSRRRLTLSTSGLVPGIDKIAGENTCNLAVSLHATHDALRDRLVPINKSFPIGALLAACRRYAKIRRVDTITFEYVMLDGINDSEAEARMLIKLMRGLPAKINLIPFNPFPGTVYRRSPQTTIDRFKDILIKGGLVTVVRKTRGSKIDAACGQLVGRVTARAERYRNCTGRRQAVEVA